MQSVVQLFNEYYSLRRWTYFADPVNVIFLDYQGPGRAIDSCGPGQDIKAGNLGTINIPRPPSYSYRLIPSPIWLYITEVWYWHWLHDIIAIKSHRNTILEALLAADIKDFMN